MLQDGEAPRENSAATGAGRKDSLPVRPIGRLRSAEPTRCPWNGGWVRCCGCCSCPCPSSWDWDWGGSRPGHRAAMRRRRLGRRAARLRGARHVESRRRAGRDHRSRALAGVRGALQRRHLRRAHAEGHEPGGLLRDRARRVARVVGLRHGVGLRAVDLRVRRRERLPLRAAGRAGPRLDHRRRSAPARRRPARAARPARDSRSRAPSTRPSATGSRCAADRAGTRSIRVVGVDLSGCPNNPAACWFEVALHDPNMEFGQNPQTAGYATGIGYLAPGTMRIAAPDQPGYAANDLAHCVDVCTSRTGANCIASTAFTRTDSYVGWYLGASDATLDPASPAVMTRRMLIVDTRNTVAESIGGAGQVDRICFADPIPPEWVPGHRLRGPIRRGVARLLARRLVGVVPSGDGALRGRRRRRRPRLPRRVRRLRLRLLRRLGEARDARRHARVPGAVPGHRDRVVGARHRRPNLRSASRLQRPLARHPQLRRALRRPRRAGRHAHAHRLDGHLLRRHRSLDRQRLPRPRARGHALRSGRPAVRLADPLRGRRRHLHRSARARPDHLSPPALDLVVERDRRLDRGRRLPRLRSRSDGAPRGRAHRDVPELDRLQGRDRRPDLQRPLRDRRHALRRPGARRSGARSRREHGPRRREPARLRRPDGDVSRAALRACPQLVAHRLGSADRLPGPRGRRRLLRGARRDRSRGDPRLGAGRRMR